VIEGAGHEAKGAETAAIVTDQGIATDRESGQKTGEEAEVVETAEISLEIEAETEVKTKTAKIAASEVSPGNVSEASRRMLTIARSKARIRTTQVVRSPARRKVVRLTRTFLNKEARNKRVWIPIRRKRASMAARIKMGRIMLLRSPARMKMSRLFRRKPKTKIEKTVSHL